MSDLTDMAAKSHGNANSVNINLGEGFRQFQIILIALIVALVFSCTVAIVAYQKASDAAVESRQWAYWAQRVESSLVVRGISLPPDPDAVKEGHK